MHADDILIGSEYFAFDNIIGFTFLLECIVNKLGLKLTRYIKSFLKTHELKKKKLEKNL